jgi:signal transduction histidine kinase
MAAMTAWQKNFAPPRGAHGTGKLRDALLVLADQQAALRRVATLVAQGTTAAELFAAVVEEVVQILDVPAGWLWRYEPDGSVAVLAAVNDPGFPVGSRWPLDGPSLSATVFQTGRPARIDDYSELAGTIAARTRDAGFGSAFGVPIIVDGTVWGLICVGTTEPAPLPADTEERLADFTELVVTAIANSQARDDLRRLADEQAALRRVATLVAEGTSADALFSAVGEEVARVLDVHAVTLARFEPDSSFTVLGACGESGFSVGSRWPLDGDSLAARVHESGYSARIDDYSTLQGAIAAAVRTSPIVSTAASPIAVEGKVWGMICVGGHARLPTDTETRLARFTELVATAVSNASKSADLISSRARIVAAADEARRRIERNLHDGTQQQLIALRLDLRGVRATVPARQRRLRAHLQRIEHDLEAVFDDVRELSQGLHPSVLVHAGLGPALSALARRSPIQVDLHLDTDERPPQSAEIAVYYVVSEALTNAAKHSQATCITITVTATAGRLHATIQDNGVGGADTSKGSGLLGLTDRVEALGGRLTLTTPPDHGTRITVELPLVAARTG